MHTSLHSNPIDVKSQNFVKLYLHIVLKRSYFAKLTEISSFTKRSNKIIAILLKFYLHPRIEFT